MEMTAANWALAGLAGTVIGFTKTGLAGVGVLGVVLMASAVPARASTGVLLPLLIVGDAFAIWYYRRHASWPHLVKLAPAVAVGMAGGIYALMTFQGDKAFGRLLGVIVLVLVALYAVRRFSRSAWLEGAPHTPWFAVMTGVFAGFTTAFGNAAGAMMSIYMLSMGLDKHQFMGTSAWFFLIVNLVKVAPYAFLRLITPETLWIDLRLVPLVAVGALVGPHVLRVIPQRAFEAAVMVLIALGGARLLAGV